MLILFNCTPSGSSTQSWTLFRSVTPVKEGRAKWKIGGWAREERKRQEESFLLYLPNRGGAGEWNRQSGGCFPCPYWRVDMNHCVGPTPAKILHQKWPHLLCTWARNGAPRITWGDRICGALWPLTCAGHQMGAAVERNTRAILTRLKCVQRTLVPRARCENV